MSDQVGSDLAHSTWQTDCAPQQAEGKRVRFAEVSNSAVLKPPSYAVSIFEAGQRSCYSVEGLRRPDGQDVPA